ncbi:MAG: insulinase family protein [Cytophagales bacterium]|nr:insulinase family protein [Cytophagales bacterium]
MFRLALLFILFSMAVFGQDLKTLENLNNPIPIDSKIIKGKLENGLTYYIRQNKKPENRAELRLVVKVGSIVEDEDQLGLAHFMEHMAFNGTKNFAKNDLVSYLQSIGVKFGADLNAYTSFDETVYILPVPTDDKKILSQSFQILEDWAHNVTLDHEEIDNERGIVIEEWRTGRGANQRMRDKNFPVLLKDSKYADRLPIGTLENLENFKYESLKRFYKEWYRPDLMAVIAIGDFDIGDIEAQIKNHFAHIKNPDRPRARKTFDIPDHQETLVTIASDKEATFSTIGLYIKNDYSPEIVLKDYYNSLLNSFYTGMLNQRLQEISQKPSPPFIYAGTSYGKFLGNKSAFTAMANVNEGDLLKGLERVLTETKRVKQYGFTEPELERFKKDILSFYESAFNERDKSPSRNYAREYIRNFLTDEPIPGIEFEYAFAQKYINQISLEEINKLSNVFFRPDNRVIVANAPEKDDLQLPTEKDILSVIERISEMNVAPYIDDLADAVLMKTLPESGSVTSEKKLNAIDVTEIVLSNGVRIILKPTDFKNDQVIFSAWSDGGTSIYPDEEYQSAINADDVVNECGIDSFSPTDLQKILAGNTANVRPFIGALGEGMNGSASPKDLKTMFQLIHLYFTAPNKNRDLFQSYIDKNKALYKNLLSNPNYYFYNESNKILTQNHPRGGRFPSDEDWDKIDFDRTFEIYKERFANAADFDFVFVGNFNIDSIKSYINQYVASLPSNGEKETWKDLGIRPPSGVVKQDILKGADPKSSVSIRFHGAYRFDRETNYLFKTLTDVLNIILIEKIREEQSGVYGISAQPSTNKNPYNNYAISIRFPCKPENSEALTNSVYDILKSIQDEGISDEHFEKVIETQKRDMEIKIKENGYWMGALKYSYQYGYNPEEIINYEERINAITKEEVQSIAKEYINFENYICLRLLPEK